MFFNEGFLVTTCVGCVVLSNHFYLCLYITSFQRPLSGNAFGGRSDADVIKSVIGELKARSSGSAVERQRRQPQKRTFKQMYFPALFLFSVCLSPVVRSQLFRSHMSVA